MIKLSLKKGILLLGGDFMDKVFTDEEVKKIQEILDDISTLLNIKPKSTSNDQKKE